MLKTLHEYRVYKCRMVGNQMILIGNFAGKLTLKKGGSRPQKKKRFEVILLCERTRNQQI
jgi:hypothetical protein